MTRGSVVNLLVWNRIVDDFEVMRKYDAVGISESILLDLKRKGVHLVRILRVSKTAETRVYFVPVDNFLSSSKKHTFLKDDVNLFVSFCDMLLLHKVSRQKKLSVVQT